MRWLSSYSSLKKTGPSSASAYNAAISPPAHSARSPAPRTITRAILSSLSHSLRVRVIALIISRFSALSALGRFNVIMPARPSLLTSTDSVILSSIIIFPTVELRLARLRRTEQRQLSRPHGPRHEQRARRDARRRNQWGDPSRSRHLEH